MNRLDHVVIAAPDLAAAKADFEAQTGVAPADGGQHVGLGTRNALVSFGETSYLEIIAPDPEQPQEGNFGAVLGQLDDATVLHWAVRVEGLADVAARAEAAGLAPGPIRRTERAAPDGGRLVWELMGIGGHALGGVVPFYIDWLECVHPALTTPVVGALATFEVTLPADSAAVGFLTPAPAGVSVTTGTPRLSFSFDSPRGRIELSAAAPAGFAF